MTKQKTLEQLTREFAEAKKEYRSLILQFNIKSTQYDEKYQEALLRVRDAGMALNEYKTRKENE